MCHCGHAGTKHTRHLIAGLLRTKRREHDSFFFSAEEKSASHHALTLPAATRPPGSRSSAQAARGYKLHAAAGLIRALPCLPGRQRACALGEAFYYLECSPIYYCGNYPRPVGTIIIGAVDGYVTAHARHNPEHVRLFPRRE